VADIDAVVFDVNETLFSLDRMGAAFALAGADPGVVSLWFARTLRDGFALAAAGDYRPFAEVGVAAMGDVAGLPPERAREVFGAFRELDAHPDVEPAFRRLRTADVRVATLTVGAAEVTDALLARAGLTSYVERTLSVDAVRRWKPAPRPYRYAAAELGLPPERVALVAAHAWDCHGARRAGLRTGWVSRLEGAPSPVFEPADVSGDDLLAVVEALLARP
jgi:2-haloacid dehalogenase